MARPSPATERVIAVLEYVAASPGRTFSLSQLARALDVNLATMHSMLFTLCERGFLVRDPGTRAYALGPAVLSLGLSALSDHEALLRTVSPEMDYLSRSLRRQCVAAVRVGPELVTVAEFGPAGPLGLSAQPGHRTPLLPPVGTIFFAWSTESDVAHWLEALSSGDLTPKDIEACQEALTTVREAGYAIGFSSSYAAEIEHRQALVEQGQKYLSLQARMVRTRLRKSDSEADHHAVRFIAAPIFDATGSVAMAITTLYFADTLSDKEIQEHAKAIVTSTKRITASIGGRVPLST